MYKYIEFLIMEKDFAQATDKLLSNYGKVTAKERADYDSAILALSYFQPYQKHFPKLAREIYYIWKDFDQFLIEKNIFKTISIVPLLAQSLMKDIYAQYTFSLDPKNILNIHDTIMYATSMIWLGELKHAASLLVRLLQNAPLESEIWALCGKIYDILGYHQKSQLFYREAFFINPSVLNLIDVRSYLVDEIVDFFLKDLRKISILNHKEDLLEWVGISGIIGGFFNVRQTLSDEDEIFLNRRIDVYEGYYFKGVAKTNENFVKLLRLYLFKYDYYSAKNNRERVQEILKKLELLSPLIYNKL